MCPAVAAEDLVVEILDAHAQPRNAQAVQGVQLFVGQRAGLRFESDLFRFVPGKVLLQTGEKLGQLFDGKERRRAAAEVDIARPPAGEQGSLAIEGRFLVHRVEVLGHAILPGVAAGVDAEVAEMAAAAAEGQVHVDPHRRAVDRRLGDGSPRRSAPAAFQNEKGG